MQKKKFLKKISLFKIEKDDKGDFPLTLEEISSFIIRKMVDNADAFLGKKINSLVVTVPANFNDFQKHFTKNAVKLAGINVLRIINEPTAAALAYGLEKCENTNSDKEKKILVFGLGRSTFDVTILKIIKGGEQNFDIMFNKRR